MAMKYGACLIMAVMCFFGSSQAAELANPFQSCSQLLPKQKLNDCLRKALTNAIPVLVKGLPKFGIRTIDPVEIATLDIVEGTRSINLNLKFKNLNIYGFRNAKVKNIWYDLKKYKMSADLDLNENIDVIGDYKMNGKVLVLPLQGEGKCNLTLHDIACHLEITGEEFQKNGQTYMKVKDLVFTFTPKQFSMQFDNLFNGNEQLAAAALKFLNENSNEILQDLKPAIQDAFGYAFKDIANRIFTKLPYEKIFPDVHKS